MSNPRNVKTPHKAAKANASSNPRRDLERLRATIRSSTATIDAEPMITFIAIMLLAGSPHSTMELANCKFGR